MEMLTLEEIQKQEEYKTKTRIEIIQKELLEMLIKSGMTLN